MKTFSFFILILLLSSTGCQKNTSESLSEVSIYIPNVIFINSENNNRLFVKSRQLGSNFSLLVEYLEVYDRSGSLLFRNEQFPTNESEYGWNGTYQGNLVEHGTYTYSIQITDNIEVGHYIGDVTVFR